MECGEFNCIKLAIGTCRCNCSKKLCSYHLKKHYKEIQIEHLPLVQSQNHIKKLGDIKLEIISAAERIISKVHYHSSQLLQSLNIIPPYKQSLENLQDIKLDLKFEKQAISSIEACFKANSLPPSGPILSIIHLNQLSINSIKTNLKDYLHFMDVEEFIKFKNFKEDALRLQNIELISKEKGLMSREKELNIIEEKNIREKRIINKGYEDLKIFFKKLKFEIEDQINDEKKFILEFFMKEKEKIESKHSELMKSKQNLEIEKREFGIEKDLFQIYIKEETEKIEVNKMNNKNKIEINAAEVGLQNGGKDLIVAMKPNLYNTIQPRSKTTRFNLSSEDNLDERIFEAKKLKLESFYEDYIQNPHLLKKDLRITYDELFLFLCTSNSDCTLNSDFIGKSLQRIRYPLKRQYTLNRMYIFYSWEYSINSLSLEPINQKAPNQI